MCLFAPEQSQKRRNPRWHRSCNDSEKPKVGRQGASSLEPIEQR